MGYVVLDTDVASKLQRGAVPADLRDYLDGKRIAVTFVSVGEFYKGAYQRGWGPKRITELERWLRNVVVLPYDVGVSRKWGEISAIKGRPVPVNDAWIAACCLRHDLPLATLNRRHFEHIRGLVLVPESRE
ncbi:MAG TPA: type II toxin-antitoxin system VapC family toxin [Gaiellaceae bacterium]|nr:type II toxin-antitoxin system VapC family toxin [Gaiellaceae bacterium]